MSRVSRRLRRPFIKLSAVSIFCSSMPGVADPQTRRKVGRSRLRPLDRDYSERTVLPRSGAAADPGESRLELNTSIQDRIGLPNCSVYAATKAALRPLA